MNKTEIATPEHELQRFVQGPRVADRAEALTALMTVRALASSSKSPEFSKGVEELLKSAGSGGDDERLLSIAQLVRISQALKPFAQRIRTAVSPLIAERLPPLTLLRNGDDRAYVAQACQWVDAEWVTAYAAEGIVTEEIAEKARAELVGVLVARTASLSETLAFIRAPLLRWKPATEEPAESIARRITRILAALRTQLALRSFHPGQKPGGVLADLLGSSFESIGLPTDDGVRIALAREVLLLTQAFVRSRFSLAIDATAYAAVRFGRQLFGSRGWPGKLHEETEVLAELMLEGILLLARQGIPAESIAEQLAVVVDSRVRVDSLLKELAGQNPEIPEEVRAWLRREPTRSTLVDRSRLEASQDLRADPSIAEAMLESRRLEEAQWTLRSGVLPSLSVLDPSQVTYVENLDSRIDSLTKAIGEIAAVRRLMVFGAFGEEIKFQPKYFDVAGSIPKEVAKIVRPAVVRIAGDGSPGEVVLKGIVE